MKILTMTFIFLMATAFAKTPKENKTFLKCIRSIIQSEKATTVELNEVTNLLQDFKITSIEENNQLCKNLLKKTKKLKKRNREDVRKDIYALTPGNENLMMMLYDLFNPNGECKTLGGQVQAAVGIGLGFGAAISGCTLSDGRIWTIVIPTLGIEFGAGAMLKVAYREIDISKDEYIDGDYGMDWAAGFGPSQFNDGSGVNLGVGVLYSVEKYFPIRMFPTGNNFKELNQRLLDL